MNYLHSDLGQLSAGSVVVVELSGHEANVQLVDSTNLSRYRRRESFRYAGGHFTHSPARIRVPSTGHWHVLVDLGGRPGRVGASVQVIAA